MAVTTPRLKLAAALDTASPIAALSRRVTLSNLAEAPSITTTASPSGGSVPRPTRSLAVRVVPASAITAPTSRFRASALCEMSSFAPTLTSSPWPKFPLGSGSVSRINSRFTAATP